MAKSRSFQEETMLNNNISTVDVEMKRPKANGISWNVPQYGDVGMVDKYPK
jgi:hypothetical protein